MYVQKDLTLAPLLERVEEDPIGADREVNVAGSKIDKTFYGRIKLTDDRESSHHYKQPNLPVVEKFDLHDAASKGSQASQIDFPEVRILVDEVINEEVVEEHLVSSPTLR